MLYIRHGWYVNRIKVDTENMLGAKYRLSHWRGEPTNHPASMRNLYFMFLWSHPAQYRFSFPSFLSRKTASLLSIRAVNKSGDQCICRQTDVEQRSIDFTASSKIDPYYVSLEKFLSTCSRKDHVTQSATESLRAYLEGMTESITENMRLRFYEFI